MDKSTMGSIRTPFNRRATRGERRLLINGHWVRPPEAQAAHQTLAWLRSDSTAGGSTIVAYGR